MFSILFILLLPFSGATLIKTSLLSTFDTSQVSEFYSKLDFSASNYQKFKPSPFSFDHDCVEIHKTHSFLFSGCTLPPSCGKVSSHLLSTSIFGFENLMCYSFHKNSTSPEILISPITPAPRFSLSFHDNLKEYGYFENISLIHIDDFLSHFYIVSSTQGFALLPRICLENYSNLNSSFPPSVTFKQVGSDFCITHSSPIACDLRFFSDIKSILFYYDYPVSFDKAPFSNGSFEKTGNLEISALDEYYSSTRRFLIDSDTDNFFFSLRDIHSIPTPLIFKLPKTPINPVEFCFPVHSKYANPLISIFRFLLEILEELFLKIITTLDKLLSPIIQLLISFIFNLIKELLLIINDYLNKVPFLFQFYDVIFVFSASLLFFQFFTSVLISLLYIFNLFYFSHITINNE
ncbi:ORF2 [Nelorpivirus dungfly]|nr:ORF2 [Nelorpivirus dungfly]